MDENFWGGREGNHSNEELLNVSLEGKDLGLELRSLVRGHGAGNHGPGGTAGTAKGLLGGNKDVGNVLIEKKKEEKKSEKKEKKNLSVIFEASNLVLAEKGQVKENLNGLSVSSHDDELGDTAVEGLGG